jgi:hypothetical protein
LIIGSISDILPDICFSDWVFEEYLAWVEKEILMRKRLIIVDFKREYE